MTTCWRKLPTEVWINIFTQINSTTTLIECRKTCKEWDPLAERAMFSGEFAFPESKAKLMQLHEHVSRKPTLGRYPREIRIGRDIMAEHMDLRTSLLRLLVNPNITSITCIDLLQPELFSTLHQMLQESPLNACKLKMMPKPERCNNQYWEALCKLKDTLQGARLDLDEMAANGLANDVYAQLKDFKSLKSLSFLRHSYGSILELDGFLDTLPQLEELKASINFIPGDYVPKSRADLEVWLKEKNIKKNNNLKKLDIAYAPEASYFDNLIEYLMIKYPLLEDLTVREAEAEADMKRFLTAIKHVPRLNISSFVVDNDEPSGIRETIQQLKDKDNELHVSYALPEGTPCAEFGYSKCKTLKPQHCFDITIPANLTNINHLDVLSQFATVDTLHAYVSVFDRRLWGQCNEATFKYSLYHVLKMVPYIQQLTYDDMQIRFQKLEAGSLILRDLTRLNLGGADLDIRVLSQLSNIAPNLQSLTINGCRLLHGTKVLKNLYQLNMQFTSFAVLEISYQKNFIMPAEIDDKQEVAEEQHLKAIRDANVVNGPAFLHLQIRSSTLSQGDLYYMLLNNAPALPLSAEEFKAHYKKPSTLFEIACKSLENLNINLAGFSVDLKFDQNYNLTNGSWK
ncbi:hypothetical protein MBANPS3_001817 [Mucor bainieri]